MMEKISDMGLGFDLKWVKLYKLAYSTLCQRWKEGINFGTLVGTL